MPVILDGSRELDRADVGGKAWGLNRMRAMGLPVPPAFALPTTLCAEVAAAGALPDAVREQLRRGVAWLEGEMDRTFAAGPRPLLVSVRSGAANSMPGMMDTVLNLGITDELRGAVAAETGDAAFADDVATRFARQFEEVVGTPAPADPWAQLEAAALAVFTSWTSPRAVTYREHHGIPDSGGTAVTVQAMVFGNVGDRSGTGVLFTRNPLTGDAAPLGEYLPGGQGEDVVSGRHDPLPLTAMAEREPACHDELLTAARSLEADARDVQDIEFTVQEGRLWLLQTRAAKRSPDAAIRLAVALAEEGVITPAEALGRVSANDLAATLRPHVDPVARRDATVLATGEPACPGVGFGVIADDAEAAEDLADERDVVLARPTTDPDDVHGMIASSAVITELGGSTSHAAVVCRELGRPCVVGCGAGALAPLTGREVTVDGAAGEILDGILPLVERDPSQDPDLVRLRTWAADHPDAAGHLAGRL
ncbi:MAG: pyruvate, phosphate dikinase [Solirubrobacteraceae bacterium]|nr:pyruvate, phosphate dikinase [Solirubrobacteraceae bacterium]